MSNDATVSPAPLTDHPLADHLALVTGGGSGIGLACASAGAAGKLRIVVANAGTGSAGPFHTTTLDDWNSVLGTDLTGVFLTMKRAVPYLAANGRGSIVAISSIAGVATHRYMTPCNVSKAGLEMLVRQVADELARWGSARTRCARASCRPTSPPGLSHRPTSSGTTWSRCHSAGSVRPTTSLGDGRRRRTTRPVCLTRRRTTGVTPERPFPAIGSVVRWSNSRLVSALGILSAPVLRCVSNIEEFPQ